VTRDDDIPLARTNLCARSPLRLDQAYPQTSKKTQCQLQPQGLQHRPSLPPLLPPPLQTHSTQVGNMHTLTHVHMYTHTQINTYLQRGTCTHIQTYEGTHTHPLSLSLSLSLSLTNSHPHTHTHTHTHTRTTPQMLNPPQVLTRELDPHPRLHFQK